MKTSAELLEKAVEEMNAAARHLSEASTYLMEAKIRSAPTPVVKSYDNAAERLRRLLEKTEKAANDFKRLPT